MIGLSGLSDSNTIFIISGVIIGMGIAILFLRYLMDDMRCHHAEYCPWYNEESPVCNETGGQYGFEHAAGCCDTLDKMIMSRKAELKKASKFKKWRNYKDED